jgi:two-component system phosphate regulon response regulator PhoB/two-component system alkaline phosphatase synthesis response regulator PhoP
MEAAMKPRLIAILDDEPDIVDLVRLQLESAGFKVQGFTAPAAFLRFLERTVPDLVVLDLMLPDTDGLEITKWLRRQERLAAVPVLILTARADESDKILGLELGADDYITKPFSAKELVARVKALLRRIESGAPERPIQVGQILAIDPARHAASVEGRPIELTATEFRILELLAGKSGRVFSREQILDALWGHDKIVLDRTVDVHIKNLREKLGPAGRLIKNIRGVGYKVEE